MLVQHRVHWDLAIDLRDLLILEWSDDNMAFKVSFAHVAVSNRRVLCSGALRNH